MKTLTLGLVVLGLSLSLYAVAEAASYQSRSEAGSRAWTVAKRDCDVRDRCERYLASQCLRESRASHSCRVTIFARERSGRKYRCTRIILIKERRFDWLWRALTRRQCYYDWR